MSKPHGIIIFGASGSGTTALGRELARVLNFAHFDIDDYFWGESDIPFTAVRPRKERQDLLLADLERSGNFVISECAANWDEPLLPLLDLAVFVTTLADVRMEHIERREYDRFGDRIKLNGDMYELHLNFVEWAKTYDSGGLDMRSLALHEQWIENCPCPVIRVDGMADYRVTAAAIAKQYYTKPGEPRRVTTAPLGSLGTLKNYRFTVVFARIRKTGGWLYARHKLRSTWETAGGHIELGETPLDCAKRELYEETGALKFYINPAFDYSVNTPSGFSYGQVFFADIEELGALPPEHEMAEVKAFETIPDTMTYPCILPVLFTEMQRWLGLDKPSTEFWDVFDSGRNPTGRTHRRSDPLPDGDFHLVVRAWIVNSRGEFLITRRAFNKIGYPGMWEVPSGSAVAGEDSLTAAIREAAEESGIVLLPENAELFSS
ncbi:MAG: NUDIX domain-containing protein, partial [Oscillospiraceae bacterium]|nr:NUDIX domain-containing protein [Oscillospiraceae bacterium]